MEKLKDSSLKKVLEYKKYEDIYDFTSLECKVARLITIFFVFGYIIASLIIGQDVIAEKLIAYLNNICIALIGFLGFIVTGLSILTGTISSKVVGHLQDRKKLEPLEKILLSYYLLGLISAAMIMEIGLIYLFLLFSGSLFGRIDSRFLMEIISLVLGVISVLVNVYIFTFIIFYAVKLIGNCLEIFYIVNNMQILVEKQEDSINKYNAYKVRALEDILLKNNGINMIDEYRKNIKKMIESDKLSEEEQQLVLVHFYEQFKHK